MTTAIMTIAGPTSDLAREARLHTGPAELAETGGMAEVEVMPDALAELIQANRLALSRTVHRLSSQYGITPRLSGTLTPKPKTFPNTLLNLIKVPRISAWLTRLHTYT